VTCIQTKCGSRLDFSFPSDGFKIDEDRGRKAAKFLSVIDSSHWHVRATCLTHHVILDFIIRTILARSKKSQNSSLCSLLHSPVTSPLLGQNIFLSFLFSNALGHFPPSNPYKMSEEIFSVYFNLEFFIHQIGRQTILLFVLFVFFPPWRYGHTRTRVSSFLRFLDYTQRCTTVGRTPLYSVQIVAKKSTWQQPTLTKYRHPCPRWDMNPQSQ
jgi:hypothetical protein